VHFNPAQGLGSVVVCCHRETKFRDQRTTDKDAKSEFIVPDFRTSTSIVARRRYRGIPWSGDPAACRKLRNTDDENL